MSSQENASDSTKPVVKEKNPHNYRRVGYSMIVISISLVLIGLLVWAIGSDYHFSSDLMAHQEIVSMTPRNGFNILYFDNTQPVGEKLEMLDHANSLSAATKLQDQYTKQYAGKPGGIVVFNATIDANEKHIADVKAQLAALAAQQAAERAKEAQAAQANSTNSTTST